MSQRIRLTMEVPVDSRHGLVAGRVMEVVEVADEGGRATVQWWVIGDLGEKVGVLFREAEIVPPTTSLTNALGEVVEPVAEREVPNDDAA